MSKKLIVALSLAAFLLTSFAFIPTASARTQYVCYWTGVSNKLKGTVITSYFYDPTGNLLFTRTLVAQTDNASFYAAVWVPSGGYESMYLSYQGSTVFVGTFSFDSYTLPISDCDGGGITDGRLNDGAGQQAAPVAIYCSAVGDGGIDVYDIDLSSQGTLAFRAYIGEIQTALSQAASGGVSVQIAEGLGDSLWATAGGSLSVVGPDARDASKTYRFDFASDSCGG